jgi:signal peptidase II
MSEPAPSAGSATPARRRPAVVAAAVGAVLVADQLTKRWALDALDGGRTIEIVWTLRFNLVFNSGMAFSQARGAGPVIGVAALLIAAGILVAHRRGGGTGRAVATGLVVGGALGNVVDRATRGDGFLQGAVVDFVDLQWFPVFNVADAAITVGAAMLVWLGARVPRT